MLVFTHLHNYLSKAHILALSTPQYFKAAIDRKKYAPVLYGKSSS